MKIFKWEIGKKKENKELDVKEMRKLQLMNLRLNAVSGLNKLTMDEDGIVDQTKAVKMILDMELENEKAESEEKERRLKTLTYVVLAGGTLVLSVLEYKLSKEFANNVWNEQIGDKVVSPKMSGTYGKLKDSFSKNVNSLTNRAFNNLR